MYDKIVADKQAANRDCDQNMGENIMKITDNENHLSSNIEAVITSHNQGSMILEAVQSVCNQTLLPKRITIVDDGSTDKYSLDILSSIRNDVNFSVPIAIYFQENRGVSAARNT